MTAFLRSVKADLLDVRLLPFLALVGVALVAAVAYAVLGGGDATPHPARPRRLPPPPSRASRSASPAEPEGRGRDHQRLLPPARGGLRNPFTPLPGAQATTTSAFSPLAPVHARPRGPPKPAPGRRVRAGERPPATPEAADAGEASASLVYHVAVLFGVAPPARRRRACS